MLKLIRQAWRVADLRRKMLFTLMVIVVFRLGNAVTVPFVNTDLLRSQADVLNGSVFGLFNLMSGGAFSMAKLFALSIQPYINASIIIQLLCVAIPALEEISKEQGEMGKKKIKRYTHIATGFIAVLQALGYYLLLSRYGVLTDSVSPVLSGTVICACLVAGSCLLTFLGDRVEKKGIGNGISIILFASIISRLPSAIMNIVSQVRTWWTIHSGAVTLESLTAAGMNETSAQDYLSSIQAPWVTLLLLMGAATIILLIIYTYDVERRIMVQHAAPVRNSAMRVNQQTFIPFKLTMASVLPVIFAQSILSLPAMLWTFIGLPHEGSVAYAIYTALTTYSPIYMAAYFLLIIGFSYFYNSIQCNTTEMANNLKRNGSFVPGFRPGRPTAELLANALKWVTFYGALYLSIIALAPMVVSHFVQNTSVAMGGTSVIIVVSVAIETAKALGSQLSLYNYKGFLA